ncbi:hypothetical protein Tco_0518075 [Tanacetum coccineum]
MDEMESEDVVDDENGAGWDRKSLWSSLKDHKYIVNGSPWAITSDFNVTLVVNEHSNGSSSFSNVMKESYECTAEVEIKDINS